MKQPDAVFDEQLATGWARIEFYGDRGKAAGFLTAARAQLGAMRTMYGVNARLADGESGGFYHATRTLPDGTTIQTITNNGQDTIRISASSTVSESEAPDIPVEYDEEFLAVAGRFKTDSADWAPFRWKPDTGFDFPAFLPDYYYGDAIGISWDGETVAGNMGGDYDDEAYIWTKAGGTVGLGPTSFATGLSGDGSTVTGYDFADTWYWRAGTGKVVLDGDPGKAARALTASADGSLIGGWTARDNGYGATIHVGAIWNVIAGGFTAIADGSGATYTTTLARSQHSVITSDGTVVSTSDTTFYPGHYNNGVYVRPHFISTITDSNGNVTTTDQTSTTYTENAPNYPYSVISSQTTTTNPSASETRTTVVDTVQWTVPDEVRVTGLSFDGARACGVCGPGSTAFIWLAAATNTLPAGITHLGYLPGDSSSEALGISADGTTVIGRSLSGTDGWRWFFWTEAAGMVMAGNGSGNAVSQGGVYGAGRSGSQPTSAGSLCVMRTPPDPGTGVVTQTDIGAALGATYSEGQAITAITIHHNADGSTTYEPDLPGLSL